MILDLHLGENADLTLTYKLYDNSVSRLFLRTYVDTRKSSSE